MQLNDLIRGFVDLIRVSKPPITDLDFDLICPSKVALQRKFAPFARSIRLVSKPNPRTRLFDFMCPSKWICSVSLPLSAH
jgi:hypothetical protein